MCDHRFRPCRYTAAIYAARANLKPVLYTGLQMGGQLTTTTEVENFPGYPEGVTGPVMMEDMRKQAERFGTDIRFGIVTAVDFSGHPHKLTIDDCKQIEADAVIIATGASAKYLGLPTEEKFRGLGVSACATCDGFFYRGKDVAVVGGGDTACEEATYLAGLCRKVYLIVRKNYLRASKAMQQRVFILKTSKCFSNTIRLNFTVRIWDSKVHVCCIGKANRKNVKKTLRSTDSSWLSVIIRIPKYSVSM